MNCKNCNQTIEGNFCKHCGQSTKVGKINLRTFLSELSGSIFQVDRGLFYTLIALFVRPGHTIKEYLDGKRKKHFKPIAYAFTLSTIYFLLSQFVGSETFMNDAVTGFTIGSNGSELDINQLATLNWFAKNYSYTTLMLLPIFSLASYLAFFKSEFNYLEHVILNAYIVGQQAIFYSFTALLSLLIDHEDFLVLTTIFISISYAFFVFWQFFSKQRRVAVVLRFLLTYVLYLIMLFPLLLLLLLILQ